MVGGVTGVGGGITSLRQLIGGEYAGAINTDLRCHGLPGIDWAGTYDLSWWDLLEFVKHECSKPDANLFRQVNPEYETVQDFYSKFSAQAIADLRWMSASKFSSEDGSMPPGLERFGLYDLLPSDDSDSADSEAAVSGARSVAEELMAAS